VYFGTDAQKQKYLPRLATGEIVSCYALTEPGSGSDALAARSRADLSKDGTHYVLNGDKCFITTAASPISSSCSPRSTATNSARSSWSAAMKPLIGAEEKKMGIKGSSTVQVFMENVKVPVENLLGEAGRATRLRSTF